MSDTFFLITAEEPPTTPTPKLDRIVSPGPIRHAERRQTLTIIGSLRLSGHVYSSRSLMMQICIYREYSRGTSFLSMNFSPLRFDRYVSSRVHRVCRGLRSYSVYSAIKMSPFSLCSEKVPLSTFHCKKNNFCK